MLGPRDEGQLTSGTGGWTVSHRRWTGPEDGRQEHTGLGEAGGRCEEEKIPGDSGQIQWLLDRPTTNTAPARAPVLSVCLMIFDSHNLAGERNTGRAGPQEDKDSKEVFFRGKK